MSRLRSKLQAPRRYLATKCTNQPKLNKRYQPDYYGALGIDDPNISHEELLKVVKQKRIDVHPDRLKRQEGLSPKDLAEIDTVAKEIGEAAVDLSNPKDRGKYDQKVAAWEAKERATMYAQQGWRPKERVREGW